MNQVYNFDKSFQQRLKEYNDVFSGFELLPSSSLSKEWSYYLEMALDPTGWQAIWKISRTTCESLKIPFPTIVLVFVLNVDFATLEAKVRILAVQDDTIQIPEKHYVPLIQLWPTKSQDRTIALNLSSTANVIDMLRFFYLHLFMPWDLEDEDSADWKTLHLESRLRLYYDVKNGVIPKITSERLISLQTEARRLQNKKEFIEFELEDSTLDTISNQEYVDQLTDVHLRLYEIKNEVEILENPLLRKALIRRNQTQVISNDYVSKDRQIYLIHEKSSLKNFMHFLENAKKFYPEDEVVVQPNLSLTLECANPNDVFVLSEGEHMIHASGAIGIECLKGIGDRDKIILISTLEDVMCDFQGNECLVDNVTLNAKSSQCAVVIRKGKVIMSNCKIFGDNHSTTHQGIIVLAGAELKLKNCEINGFYTAIVGNSGSKITIEGTQIYDVHIGLRIYDNSFVNLHKSSFKNCKEYGVHVDTENNLDGERHKVGDFDVLKIMPEVTAEFVDGVDNNKGDVFINQTSQISAIEDLFSHHDPTISENPSEEEMETEDDIDNKLDQTVIERNVSPATI